LSLCSKNLIVIMSLSFFFGLLVTCRVQAIVTLCCACGRVMALARCYGLVNKKLFIVPTTKSTVRAASRGWSRDPFILSYIYLCFALWAIITFSTSVCCEYIPMHSWWGVTASGFPRRSIGIAVLYLTTFGTFIHCSFDGFLNHPKRQ
jgi:hypothetical protein